MSDNEDAAVLTAEELANIRTLMANSRKTEDDNKKLRVQLEKAKQQIANLSDIHNGHIPVIIVDQQSQAKTPVLKEGMSYSQFKFDIECWQKATPKVAGKDRGAKLIACWPENDGNGGLKKTLVSRLGWDKIEHANGMAHILKELEAIMCCPSWVRSANWQDNWDSLEQGSEQFEAFINKVREARKTASKDFGFEVPQPMVCSKILRGCHTVTADNVGIIT